MNWDRDYVEFDAEVSIQEDEVVFEVPSQILARSPVAPEELVRVGLFEQKNSSDGSSNSGQTPPIVEGDRLTLEIVTEGEQGDGVGFVDEFAVIVPGGSVGTRPTVEVTDVKDSYAFAQLSGEK